MLQHNIKCRVKLFLWMIVSALKSNYTVFGVCFLDTMFPEQLKMYSEAELLAHSLRYFSTSLAKVGSTYELSCIVEDLIRHPVMVA